MLSPQPHIERIFFSAQFKSTNIFHIQYKNRKKQPEIKCGSTKVIDIAYKQCKAKQNRTEQNKNDLNAKFNFTKMTSRCIIFVNIYN